VLKLINVEVKFHEVILVLKGLSIEVPEGKVVCLLGANGAGKTTTLKAISGILDAENGKVTDGFIEFFGQRIDRLDAEKINELGIQHVMEGRRVLEHLTAEENLKAGALGLKDRKIKNDLEKVYGYFPQIAQLRKRTAGYLSGGEQQMVVIGRALMGRPRVFLLDEPSLGLSPRLVREIFSILKRIHHENAMSMLLVEQNAMLALEVSEYGYVIENGRVVLDGRTEELRENEDIKEFYLGLSNMNQKKSYREVKHYKRRKRWL
jgi:branched-chain amino acid transport system ATP-binding protein